MGGQADGVHGRIVGVLNDSNRAAWTLPGDLRGDEQIHEQRVVVVEIGV
jgi:hypothetical protein